MPSEVDDEYEFGVLPGITFVKWSSLRIPAGGLAIGLNSDGESMTSVVMETHIPMWIHWLDICHQHVKTTAGARKASLEARRRGETEAPHDSMHAEFQAAVQAISAAAFAMEAFSNTLDDLGVVNAETRERWAKKRPWAADKVVDTVLAACGNSPSAIDRESIVKIFHARNGAVHPKVEFREAVLHPALKLGVDQALITYGAEHAAAAMSHAATLIARTLIDAQPHSEAVEQWIESTKDMFAEFAREREFRVQDGDRRLQELLDRRQRQGDGG